MSGQKIVLSDVSFTDTSLPILRDDPILSSGSLCLVDFGHSKGKLITVPGQGSTIVNLADETAKAIVGGSAATSFGVETALATGLCQAELTTKGGVHVMSAHSGQTSDGYWRAAFNARILTHMANNPNHHYYVSLWHRPTRASLELAAPQSYFHVGATSGTSSSGIFHYQGGLPNPVDAINYDLRFASNPNNDSNVGVVGNPRLGIIAPTSRRGTTPIAVGYLGAGSWGAWGSPNRNKAASAVIYRAYIEDLTVSGRTSAEVAAIDKALWEQAFGVDGKFYGDAWTNPNILP